MLSCVRCLQSTSAGRVPGCSRRLLIRWRTGRRALPGSLTADESPEAAHEELHRQLDHIEALLGDMPLQPPPSSAAAQSLNPSALDGNGTRAPHGASACALGPAQSESPVPPELRHSAERLSKLLQCTEARSAELTQHVALAMAQLPRMRSRSASPVRTAHPPTASPGAQQATGHAAAATAGVYTAQQAQHGAVASPSMSPEEVTCDVAQNAAVAGSRISLSPENYNELVAKIRATEARLQEAICSLTAATRNFRLARCDAAPPPPEQAPVEAIPLDNAREQLWEGGSLAQRALSLSLDGGPSCEPSPQAPTDADEQEVSWTPLNPLYPASSRSASPQPRAAQPPSRIPSPPPAAQCRPRVESRASFVTPPTPRCSGIDAEPLLVTAARSRSPSECPSQRRSTLLAPRPALHGGAAPGSEGPSPASFRLRATSSARWSAKPATLRELAEEDECEAEGMRVAAQHAPAPSHQSRHTYVAAQRTPRESWEAAPRAICNSMPPLGMAGAKAAARRSLSPQRSGLRAAGTISFREMASPPPNARLTRGSVVRESSGASHASQSTAWSLEQPSLMLHNPQRDSMLEATPGRLRHKYQAGGGDAPAFVDGTAHAAQPFARVPSARKSRTASRVSIAEPHAAPLAGARTQQLWPARC